MDQEHAASEGLRYRKKLKARLAAERAALELVLERGFDGVTVEDICARAEISKKTFFNYFPSKAAAVTGRFNAFPDDERLTAVLAEQSEACYLDVLVDVVGASLASDEDEDVAALRREALCAMPQLFFQGQRDLLAVQHSIASALRSHLAEHPDRRMPASRWRRRRWWPRPPPSALRARAPCCAFIVTASPRPPRPVASSWPTSPPGSERRAGRDRRLAANGALRHARVGLPRKVPQAP